VFLIGGKPASLSKKFSIIPKMGAPAKPATAKGASASSVVQSAIGAGAAAAVVAAAAESSAPSAAGVSAAPAYRVVPPPEESAASAGAVEASVAAKLEEGMRYLDAGRYEEAESNFQAVLSGNPRHLPALRGMAMLAIKKKDPEAALEYGRREADQLVKLQRFDTLWERYVELKKGAPNFILNAKDQFVLCRYLFQQGLFMETARTLRELAVAYPDDPISPKALYQCGELLRTKVGKPENAKQIYEYILKKYPDSPLTEQVKKALGEMSPPAGD
jgi:tetratricopeptide (TPR) repeat protein